MMCVNTYSLVKESMRQTCIIYSLSRYRGGLEDLKIETRLRDERFENVKGEYVI